MLLVSKILPALLFPVGLTILLCLLAALLAFRARARAAGFVALAAAALLYTAASPFVSNRLMLGLERENPPATDFPRVEAIVLLGGGMMSGEAPRVFPETNSSGDRVLHAARLWKHGVARRLVTTGGNIVFLAATQNGDAGEYAALLAGLFDVPGDSLLQVPDSRTTIEDAKLSARLFDSLGLRKDILLVTSAWHMPRAAGLFRKAGFEVTVAPTDFRSVENRSPKAFDLLPSASSVEETTLALKEYLGTFVYRLTGRL